MRNFQLQTIAFLTMIALSLILAGCGGDSSSPSTSGDGSNGSTGCTTATSSGWVINNIETAVNFSGTLVNVQSVACVSLSGVDYTQVTATGIPNYSRMLDSDDISFLNSRPNALTDFDTNSIVVSSVWGYNRFWAGYRVQQPPMHPGILATGAGVSYEPNQGR